MSLNVKSGGGDFEITPQGTYVARCFKIIDLGTQTTTSMYGTKSQHKVMISWELLDDSVKMNDGRPYAVTQWYTASLHEKSQLRKDLEAWRGRKFTDAELEGFDLHNIIGAYCMIQVIHSTDGKYANINAIMAYKGPQPAAINPNVIFDIDNPDMAVFEAMSDNMKARIVAAPEWTKKSQQASSNNEPTDPFSGDEMPPDFLLPDDDAADVTDEELANPTIPDLAEEPKGKK